MQQGESRLFQSRRAFEMALTCPPRWVLKDAFPVALWGSFILAISREQLSVLVTKHITVLLSPRLM
jgi:hypothetical protein